MRKNGTTTHYKCMTCATRSTAPGPCDGCGSALEPADRLAEIMGYRLMSPPAPVDGESFAMAVAIALEGIETRRP
jgi:hypothetical protein